MDNFAENLSIIRISVSFVQLHSLVRSLHRLLRKTWPGPVDILQTCAFLVTQSRSIAKSVGCFQRRLFVRQHDNFRTSKQRMMKLGGRCIVQKSRPISNVGVIAPRCAPLPQNVLMGYDV